MPLRLKEIRECRQITQQELADILGCTPVTYCRYETGARQPSIDTLLKLSEYFNVTVDYILGKDPADVSALSEYEIALIKTSREVPNHVRQDVLDYLEMKKSQK